MNHKQKVRKARGMMTTIERRDNISIWDSAQWLERKNSRRIRILKVKRKKLLIDFTTKI